MKDKVVIITGASSGIGLALALEFARRGAKLVLASRSGVSDPALYKLSTEILDVRTDVTKESDCEALIQKAIEKFGRIDILVNNAGISMRALFVEVKLDVLRRVMDTNFWGTVYCTKAAIPYLLESRGSLVGVSSIAGYKGLPARSGYSASKFAMQGFLEVVRIENLKKGLHVLIACPGFTASNIRNVALSKDGTSQGETPLDESKLMTSEEVARRIVHAIEKKKDRLILTSQGKLTVLLNKFFPKLTEKLVYNHMAKEPDSPLNR
ncbi:MAG: SDR family oxidoreductase [Bacteroidales bacterium]|nr:SDR family oxidoreductase [Bacteroidales bacterium]